MKLHAVVLGFCVHEAEQAPCFDAGTFNPSSMQESCFRCVSGWYGTQVGMTKCFKCPTGKFGKASGGLSCLTCQKSLLVMDVYNECPDQPHDLSGPASVRLGLRSAYLFGKAHQPSPHPSIKVHHLSLKSVAQRW